MLQQVDVGVQDPLAYEEFVGRRVMEELQALARQLRGRRILQVNSTAYGGGGSQLPLSYHPTYRCVGLDVVWQVITGDERFFGVSKAFHNALQGSEFHVSAEVQRIFEMYGTHNASLLEGDYDFIIAHDPQAVALRALHGRDGARWTWRCHIDTAAPDQEILDYLSP